MSSKSVSQIFQILFQTGGINIFVLRGVFFSRYVQSSFSDKTKTSAVKSKTRLVEKLSKINPFVPNAPFLYPLKTSENLTVF